MSSVNFHKICAIGQVLGPNEIIASILKKPTSLHIPQNQGRL